ncbi:MAG: hypothetical protein LBC92_02555, partial [Rickettsiales bacterium]|nr:hypothetical protein [Rickettsiales bacterium]
MADVNNIVQGQIDALQQLQMLLSQQSINFGQIWPMLMDTHLLETLREQGQGDEADAILKHLKSLEEAVKLEPILARQITDINMILEASTLKSLVKFTVSKINSVGFNKVKNNVGGSRDTICGLIKAEIINKIGINNLTDESQDNLSNILVSAALTGKNVFKKGDNYVNRISPTAGNNIANERSEINRSLQQTRDSIPNINSQLQGSIDNLKDDILALRDKLRLLSFLRELVKQPTLPNLTKVKEEATRIGIQSDAEINTLRSTIADMDNKKMESINLLNDVKSLGNIINPNPLVTSNVTEYKKFHGLIQVGALTLMKERTTPNFIRLKRDQKLEFIKKTISDNVKIYLRKNYIDIRSNVVDWLASVISEHYTSPTPNFDPFLISDDNLKKYIGFDKIGIFGKMEDILSGKKGLLQTNIGIIKSCGATSQTEIRNLQRSIVASLKNLGSQTPIHQTQQPSTTNINALTLPTGSIQQPSSLPLSLSSYTAQRTQIDSLLQLNSNTNASSDISLISNLEGDIKSLLPFQTAVQIAIDLSSVNTALNDLDAAAVRLNNADVRLGILQSISANTAVLQDVEQTIQYLQQQGNTTITANEISNALKDAVQAN